MKGCSECEYYKKLAQLWRDEAYEIKGHELPRKWVGLNGADWNDFNPLIANDVHRVADWVEKILRERNT